MKKPEIFEIDHRILSTSIKIKELNLSTLLFKNDKNYQWFVLVPRRNNIKEIFELNSEDRNTLIEEINLVSLFIKEYFNSHKINVGALGNIVSQLHIHVVGRSLNDPLWPEGIWQEKYKEVKYSEIELQNIFDQITLKF